MDAPGHPGIAPTWTSSAKDMVGCAFSAPRLWFTTGFGILNEVYHPRADIPQIRDLGFIVADGKGFWVEVKRLGSYRSVQPAPGIPAVEIVHEHPRFNLQLRIAPDPQRDVLLIEVSLDGDGDLRPYALLAPHLGGTGNDNSAQAGRYRGRKILWADQGPFALALAAVDGHQRDAWGIAQRRLRRNQRRLAGFLEQRRADLAIRQRRPGQRRADRRIAPPRDARARFRHQPRIGGDACLFRTHRAVRPGVAAACRFVARLAAAAASSRGPARSRAR